MSHEYDDDTLSVTSEATSTITESSTNYEHGILGSNYDSDFEDADHQAKRLVYKKQTEMPPPPPKPKPKIRSRPVMSAYERHIQYINNFVLFYGKERLKEEKSLRELERLKNYKTDYDILKEEYRFIRDDEEDDDSYEKQLARKYYEKLFKEYCLADLSKYKKKKIGLRWRLEHEVIAGKGQFTCGSVHCDKKDNLETFEVNFGYVECNEKKNALVKLRLCKKCAKKMNKIYKKRKREKEDDKRKKQKREEDDEFAEMFP